MLYYSQEYERFLAHLIVSLVLAVLMIMLSYAISPRIFLGADVEHFSAYECGFNPFSSSRESFNVHFYVVGIMFIVFDVELMFLFPWVLVAAELPFVSFKVVYAFLCLLAFGFIYEMEKDALKWHV
jgi:NADH-quinone oxidoreductase subunit A